MELALVLSLFFAPLVLGTPDMAAVVYGYIEIANAAHAGAMYGMFNPAQAGNSAGIAAAAEAEASYFPAGSITVTPAQNSYWACNNAQNGAQYATQTDANAGCTSPTYALEFVQVTVSAPVNLPFHCCGLPSSIAVSRTSVMEVQGQQ